MRGFLFTFAVILAALLCCPPAVFAAGRWVKSCGPNGCTMRYVEDAPRQVRATLAPAPRPTDAYCACPGGCRCMSTGQPSAACAKPGSAFASCPRYPAAKAQGHWESRGLFGRQRVWVKD